MSMAAPPSRHRSTSSSVPHRQPSVSVRQAPAPPSGDPRYPTTTIRVTTQRPSTADRPTRSNTVSSRSGGHTQSHSHSRSNSTSTRTNPASHPTRTTTHHSTGLKHTPSVAHHTSTRSAAPHSSSRQPHKSHTMDNVVIKNGVPIEPTTRAKPSRSMTSAPSTHAAQPSSRSLSTDRLDRQAGEKTRKTSPRPPAKKSTHVDVIDKLDYSGIGTATFHHDGPFDACAPSRNKNKTKAPMYAFDDVPLQQAEDMGNKNLSPRAQATIMAMRQTPGSSPYAIALNTEVANNYGQPPSPTYASKKKPSPKKSALAEAWGIAEPEPFEEFSAGRQSGYEQGSPMNGSRASINNTGTRTGMTTSAYPEYPDSRPQPLRRPSKPMPPPQPIQLYPEFPEGEDPVAMSTAPSAYGRPNAPKRSRSLMQRFRKMRDSPNAPPTAYEEEPPMPPAPSDIRLVNQQRVPPVPERDPYSVGVRDKSLPAPPPVANTEYFEKTHAPVSPGGINRKGSLMRKVKGVMSR
ncbi:unnamed protein product [Rhizoctonia solani]|uniref:Uncharacterized protein n=1 Tax=Rhizoctonia solani TaxID=456999 RepID=A0A8H2XKX2_9AGAM|nr:unnamed protein product [Rhizoctonia solani]